MGETRVQAQGREQNRAASLDSDDPFHWLEEGEAPPPPPEPAIPSWPNPSSLLGEMAEPPAPPWLRGRETGRVGQDEESGNQGVSSRGQLNPDQAAMVDALELHGPGADAAIGNLSHEQMVGLLKPKGLPRLTVSLGVALGIVAYAFSLSNMVLWGLQTLVHEMGHTLLHWVCGQFAIPAFDFVNGGGVTMAFPRSNLLYLLMICLISFPFFVNRAKPKMLRNWAILLGAYLVVTLSALDEFLIIAAGHGTELVWATLCFYRCLSGRDLRTPIERPIYAMVGSFAMVKAVVMGLSLMTSQAYRVEYSNKKPGMVMDLDIIAASLHLDVSVVGGLYALVSLLVIPCALALSKDENRQRLINRGLRFLGYRQSL